MSLTSFTQITDSASGKFIYFGPPELLTPSEQFVYKNQGVLRIEKFFSSENSYLFGNVYILPSIYFPTLKDIRWTNDKGHNWIANLTIQKVLRA